MITAREAVMTNCAAPTLHTSDVCRMQFECSNTPTPTDLSGVPHSDPTPEPPHSHLPLCRLHCIDNSLFGVDPCRYPADMLKDIQHDAQAVLTTATLFLESAIQHHQQWHPRKGSKGSAQLEQQLLELQANMDSLHRHLTRWQEVSQLARGLR